jgi:hypothetical protein
MMMAWLAAEAAKFAKARPASRWTSTNGDRKTEMMGFTPPSSAIWGGETGGKQREQRRKSREHSRTFENIREHSRTFENIREHSKTIEHNREQSKTIEHNRKQSKTIENNENNPTQSKTTEGTSASIGTAASTGAPYLYAVFVHFRQIRQGTTGLATHFHVLRLCVSNQRLHSPALGDLVLVFVAQTQIANRGQDFPQNFHVRASRQQRQRFQPPFLDNF